LLTFRPSEPSVHSIIGSEGEMKMAEREWRFIIGKEGETSNLFVFQPSEPIIQSIYILSTTDSFQPSEPIIQSEAEYTH